MAKTIKPYLSEIIARRIAKLILEADLQDAGRVLQLAQAAESLNLDLDIAEEESQQ